MKSPSNEEIVKYRLTRAWSTLEKVEKHIENKFWNTAVNRMYYATYYAVTALLIKQKIRVNSHAGVRQKFGQLFVNEGILSKEYGKLFTRLGDRRQLGDYDDFMDVSEAEVKNLLPATKNLIKAVADLIHQKP